MAQLFKADRIRFKTKSKLLYLAQTIDEIIEVEGTVNGELVAVGGIIYIHVACERIGKEDKHFLVDQNNIIGVIG